ncbi:zinc-ribbon domain-containing protein [Solibaculum mannosilyticum]|uniref:zinc-ribbon domain-containing protein n=1 Tax=Solibaculum mannosilyticum TaxID=2780922 RepID=UPI0036F36D44
MPKNGIRSNKKAWWICPKGHEYTATVSNRVFGRACPICSLEKRSVARNRNRIFVKGLLLSPTLI